MLFSDKQIINDYQTENISLPNFISGLSPFGETVAEKHHLVKNIIDYL